VKDIDAISGPAMLLDALKKEMMEWTIKTDATGKALCETLVIAEFRLHVPDKPTQERSKTEIIPSILRLTIEPIDHGTVTTYLVSIPAGSNSLIISKNHFKRAISRIFAHRS
jgi:hypothetical protein